MTQTSGRYPPSRGDLVANAVGVDAEPIQLTSSNDAGLVLDQLVEGLLHDKPSSPLGQGGLALSTARSLGETVAPAGTPLA
jgi:hypothetical protein